MDLSKRKQIWIALSTFYLDIELQEFQYHHIATVCRKLHFSYKEVQEIDRTEVFPTLYKNLLAITGVWDAFDEEWLIEHCTKNYQKKSARFFQFKNFLKHFIAGSHFNSNWQNFHKIINTR